jgi:hypothetical protein
LPNIVKALSIDNEALGLATYYSINRALEEVHELHAAFPKFLAVIHCIKTVVHNEQCKLPAIQYWQSPRRIKIGEDSIEELEFLIFVLSPPVGETGYDGLWSGCVRSRIFS